jgi:glutathione peroxidase-family protein
MPLPVIVLLYQSNKKISMTKYTGIILLIINLAAKAQLVSYTPLNTDFETTITIQFNLNLSKGEKTMGFIKKMFAI